jgi:hypothetical protein
MDQFKREYSMTVKPLSDAGVHCYLQDFQASSRWQWPIIINHRSDYNPLFTTRLKNIKS